MGFRLVAPLALARLRDHRDFWVHPGFYWILMTSDALARELSRFPTEL